VRRHQQAARGDAPLVLQRTYRPLGLFDVVVDDALRKWGELYLEPERAPRTNEVPVCVLLPRRSLTSQRRLSEHISSNGCKGARHGVVVIGAEVVKKVAAPALEARPPCPVACKQLIPSCEDRIVPISRRNHGFPIEAASG